VDITDIKQAQEESFDRERLESLRLLTGGIAHDFNNLMSTILITAELAEVEMGDGKRPGDEVRTIKSVASRAVEMVRELMIYAGEDKGTFEKVDVSQLVEEIIALLKTLISKRATLDFDLPRNLPAVWGNPTRIRQIAMNLVLNASEALGDATGVIHITTSRVTPGPAGDYLRLEVSDTGCGMTEEQRVRIFDPYFTTKRTGHGLGLAVVHAIVESHGGNINVATAPGRGTTVEVLLPFIQKPCGSFPSATQRQLT
jgi:signal transduction histidine kinase